MNVGPASLSSLVGGVYDAVLDPAAWPGLLGRLCDATDSVGAMLVSMDLRCTSDSRVVFARLDPSRMDRYLAEHADDDPWTTAATRLPAGAVVALDALVPMATLLGSRLYADILRPRDIRHALTSILQRDGDRVAAISLYRAGRRGAYDAGAGRVLGELVPHLRRSLAMSARLGELQAARSGLADALDALAHGVLLLDAQGHVLHTNRRAEALLKAADGLTLVGRRLVPTRAADSEGLARLIRRAAAGRGGVVGVARAPGPPAYLVQAVTLRGALAGADAAAAVLVLVSAPQATAAASADARATLLVGLYGLTAREARVAVAVGTGVGVPQVARDLGVSANTVHTHLRRVFDKLGVHSQAALAGALHRTATLADAEDGDPPPVPRGHRIM